MKRMVAASLLLRHQGEGKRRGAVRTAVVAAVAAMTALNYTHAATMTVKTLDSGTPIVLVTGEFQYGDEIEFKAKTDSAVDSDSHISEPRRQCCRRHSNRPSHQSQAIRDLRR
jgi:hypothetical protein